MSKREVICAHIDEMSDGDIKKIESEGIELVLARKDGGYYALGGVCPHKGAPMEDGLVAGKEIMCPWHHARFALATGDLMSSPARDSLSQFPVEIRGRDIVVTIPDHAKIHKDHMMTNHDPEMDDRVFIILGAGAAGAAAAETVRQSGYAGRLIMVTRENRLPYDRTDLSKGYLAGGSELFYLRDKEFYDAHDIEIIQGKDVSNLDPEKRIVHFADGDDVSYDRLLLATGSEPFVPGIPGTDLPRVYTLRGPGDADEIIEITSESHHAVLIGSGFIAMECASALRQRDLDVTIVSVEQFPFESVLGNEIGTVFKEIHEAEGVSFRMGEQVVKIEEEADSYTVHTKSGEMIQCDFVVMGTGVKPATGYLPKDLLDNDGGVTVDEYLRVPAYAESLFAAGDIARFPHPLDREISIRAEHWSVAEQLGRIAAKNMAGAKHSFSRIPFFWTRQHGKGLTYAGHVSDWDDLRTLGDLTQHSFIGFYLRKSRIMGAAGMGKGDLMAMIDACMQNGTLPTIEEIESGDVDWNARIHRAE